MTTAADLIQKHTGGVATLPSTATVMDAAVMMNERHIGSVLVVDGGTMTGIFTERDILRRELVGRLDPEATALSDVMTTVVACANSTTTLDEIRHVMRERRIRHMPVIDGDDILGMVSIGDLNEVEQEIQEQTIAYLERYVSVL